MKNKALIDALEQRYLTIEHDGGYVLYDKERSGHRNQHLYLGKFYLSTNGDKYSFNNEYYTSVEDMVGAMEEYNKTLPFDSEIYNPLFKKSYMIECALHDYLTSLGFKMYWHDCRHYELRDAYMQTLCHVVFDVKDGRTTGKIKRLITEDRWTEAPFDGLDSAISACNTILATYCASINAIAMNVLNALTNSRCTSMLDMTFDLNSLSVYTEDAKQKTIEHLEQELKRLKGE